MYVASQLFRRSSTMLVRHESEKGWGGGGGKEGVDGGEGASAYIISALEHRDNIVVNVGGQYRDNNYRGCG